MIFVDTGAWFARFVRDDPNHLRVADWLSANQEPLLTSDFCVDETLTLLVARKRPLVAMEAENEALPLADILPIIKAGARAREAS